ncbi:M13 family metallopeptidase [Silvibacterium acidisoli]|uniref:M13 family metallopeptidase n=1 Tax=Acidobacteriaceae bacterium ZG23-2 TaxID=2883246 RepID=UPI00406BF823
MAAITAFVLVLPIAGAIAQSAASGKHYELQHIDVTNVDKSVDPCSNFWQYACNKYNAANPIPPDRTRWGVAGNLYGWNHQVLGGILETNESPSASRTPNQQKIGDLYASCMNQPSSQLDAIKPLLAQIDAIHDKRSLALALAAIHKSFGRVWTANDNQTDVALFGYGPTPDANDVTRVVAGLDQGGLGMPGRDYYLSGTPDMKVLRDKYTALIATSLQLSEVPAAQSTQDAAKILELETALATAQMDNISRRDPNKVNNRFTLEQVKALVPNFDWDTYFAAMNAPPVPLYEVSSPAFFTALNKMLDSEGIATWKVYLRWQLLHAATPALGKSWRDADFAFTSALTGQKQQLSNADRCTSAVDSNLGEALGQVYVAQVFPPDSKARAQKMVKDIEAAMGRDINTVSWMQPATKQQALLKLAAVVDKIGYPDKWIDYSALTIERDNYPLNIERATAFELNRQLAFVGHPVDRKQWLMTPPTVDAYEDPQTNTINFPAGILQPIFFDTTKDDVINYGSEGAVVGHELTHDFDDQGRKFDLNGNLKDWWTPEDAKEYDERGSCISSEYTGPVPGVPDVKQNGKLTQGEDTADNGGLYLALSALAMDLKNQGKTLDDKDANGLTNLQRFFLAFANTWCTQSRPEAARNQVLTNPHSIPELRVNNVVGNMPEFQQAFSCKAGQPMVHSPRCRVW